MSQPDPAVQAEPAQPKAQVLSVVIPAYNEAPTIHKILDLVVAVPLALHKEIIVVDDGSRDGTGDAVTRWALTHKDTPGLAVRVITKQNGGKGTAVRKGIEVSTGDFVLIQDADLEYEPNDYPKLLEPLLKGETDVVYGSRTLGPDKPGTPMFYWGGRVVTWWTNLLYLTWITDEPTCYKVFRGDLIRSIPLECTGFEFCPEVTAKVLKLGHKIVDVPIRYHPRSIEEGKKIRAKDGFIALWELFRWRFKRVRTQPPGEAPKP
ncbi:MAG: glycosyltransferase family 2 protein [Planctomycetes bacterium]|nr:glycosyltransferase family 2 protein [Planctomycetota bacterium]